MIFDHDPYHLLLAEYFQSVRDLQEAQIVEIGSRNRSGIIRRDLLSQGTCYVGLDVVPIEINKVMKMGGTTMVATHQIWPLHEQPWDFWRFSEYSWAALFNRFTGFSIVRSATGEPASVVAHVLHAPTVGLPDQPARLAVAVICSKVGGIWIAGSTR